MKNGKRCVKCGSADIIKVPGKSGGYNWLPVGFGTAAVERYVCCSCGYSEEWIEEGKLAQVKEWWNSQKGDGKWKD